MINNLMIEQRKIKRLRNKCEENKFELQNLINEFKHDISEIKKHYDERLTEVESHVNDFTSKYDKVNVDIKASKDFLEQGKTLFDTFGNKIYNKCDTDYVNKEIQRLFDLVKRNESNIFMLNRKENLIDTKIQKNEDSNKNIVEKLTRITTTVESLQKEKEEKRKDSGKRSNKKNKKKHEKKTIEPHFTNVTLSKISEIDIDDQQINIQNNNELSPDHSANFTNKSECGSPSPNEQHHNEYNEIQDKVNDTNIQEEIKEEGNIIELVKIENEQEDHFNSFNIPNDKTDETRNKILQMHYSDSRDSYDSSKRNFKSKIKAVESVKHAFSKHTIATKLKDSAKRLIESSVDDEGSSSAINKDVDESSYEDSRIDTNFNNPINIKEYESYLAHSRIKRQGHFETDMDTIALFEENYLAMLDKHKDKTMSEVADLVNSKLKDLEASFKLRLDKYSKSIDEIKEISIIYEAEIKKFKRDKSDNEIYYQSIFQRINNCENDHQVLLRKVKTKIEVTIDQIKEFCKLQSCINNITISNDFGDTTTFQTNREINDVTKKFLEPVIGRTDRRNTTKIEYDFRPKTAQRNVENRQIQVQSLENKENTKQNASTQKDDNKDMKPSEIIIFKNNKFKFGNVYLAREDILNKQEKIAGIFIDKSSGLQNTTSFHKDINDLFSNSIGGSKDMNSMSTTFDNSKYRPITTESRNRLSIKDEEVMIRGNVNTELLRRKSQLSRKSIKQNDFQVKLADELDQSSSNLRVSQELLKDKISHRKDLNYSEERFNYKMIPRSKSKTQKN